MEKSGCPFTHEQICKYFTGSSPNFQSALHVVNTYILDTKMVAIWANLKNNNTEKDV